MTSFMDQLTAVELVAKYAAKTISPVEAVTESLRRIDEFDTQVNAFCHVDPEGALRSAQASERRWQAGKPLSPIDGIPTTVKDLVLSADWPTTFGSRVAKIYHPASKHAPCVARLEEAGTCLLGMTTTPELGWKGVTDSPLHGITRNPWDCTKTPGGSSGGAAAAAALGMGLLHIGTDGGGSIRMPAGFTGIVGHKPSFGRVPAYPASVFGTVAHVGPMARSVSDVASMLSILSKPDARDWHAVPFENTDYLADLKRGVKGLRIAFSPTLGYVDVNDEVAASVAAAANVFTELGAHVDTVDLDIECPQDIYHTLWFAGAARRFGQLSDEELELVDPGLQEIVKEGLQYSLKDYMDAEARRAALGSKMCQFHENYDLLLTPTLPIPAFEAGIECLPHQRRWTDWAGFSYPINLTQQPACSVPCGLTKDGLPIGLQVVGPKYADAAVLQAAFAYEQTRAWAYPHAPINFEAVTETAKI